MQFIIMITKKNPGNGSKYLVGNAFHLREEDYDKISNEEVIFFFEIISIVSTNNTGTAKVTSRNNV